MKLAELQKRLKAPKDQYNQFGGFSYRTTGAILEAAKKILNGEAVIILSDEVEHIGDRYYIKAKPAYVPSNDAPTVCYAYAREAESKKGMDVAQCSGSASTYARKYALQGLLALDDSAADPDRS